MIDAVLGSSLGDVGPGDWTPDEAAAWAARTPLHTGVLSPVGVIDTDTLSHEGNLDLLTALERLRGWIDGQQQRVLANLADGETSVRDQLGRTVAKGYVREGVAATLRLAPVTAGGRIELAVTLSEVFPATLAAVESGALSLLHARVLVDESRQCLANLGSEVSDDQRSAVAGEIERRVLAGDPAGSVGEFRRRVARIVARLDCRNTTERHRVAAQERRVCLTPDLDGMAWLSAYLPAPDAATVLTALNALTDRPTNPADERSADQRRADALVQLAVDALNPDRGTNTGPNTGSGTDAGDTDGAGLPSWQGRRPSIQVSVALSTLAGLDEQPAELDGYGPIPAELARRIAADPTGTWTRLVTDPTGRVLDYAHTRYRPPADLREHVIARDRTCRYPGCARTARRCEQDHLVAYTHGGATSATNLHTLCPRHHHLRHETDWTVQRNPDTGITTWTSPSGRRHAKPPDTVPVDQTRHRLE